MGASTSSNTGQSPSLPGKINQRVFVMLVDCQVGWLQMVKNHEPQEFNNSTMAHLGLSQTFDLPVIITTTSEAGPGGPIPQDISRQIEGLKQATLIQRDQDQSSPWQHIVFQNAVKATGRTQVILAGATELSLAPLIHSLLENKYQVFVHADACGALSTTNANDAKNRLRDAGVQVMSTTALATELAMGDKDDTRLTAFFNQYVPEYRYLSDAHDAATKHGPTQ